MNTAISVRNSALQDLSDVLSSGFARFYDGTKPASVSLPLSGNLLIVECALPNPAGSSPSDGTMLLNPISDGIVAASGSPTFARFFKSDGVTALVDLAIPAEITLAKSAWVIGESFPGPAVTFSLPEGP
jgi:hypothetical protein